MFTGIIEHLGTVETLERTGDAARLRVRAGTLTATCRTAAPWPWTACA